MEGADESTEPWRHPSFCYHKQNVSANLDQIKVENFGFFKMNVFSSVNKNYFYI